MYCGSSPGSHLPARHQAIPRYRMREQCWDDISKTFTLLYTLPVISQTMIPTQLLWVNRPLPQNWIQFNIYILLEKKCRHQQVIFCPKGLDLLPPDIYNTIYPHMIIYTDLRSFSPHVALLCPPDSMEHLEPEVWSLYVLVIGRILWICCSSTAQQPSLPGWAKMKTYPTETALL